MSSNNNNTFIFDLGPALADHCLKVAAYASDKQNKNGKDPDYLPTLLAQSTPTFLCRHQQNLNPLYDDAIALTTAWYAHMKSEHEKIITEKISKEAEECAEISSLFTTGVCSNRNAVAASELEGLFQNGASMTGSAILMKANFAPYVEYLSSKSGGAPIQVENASKMLLRAWADATIDQQWFFSSSTSSLEKSGSAKNSSVFGATSQKIFSISYSVSSDLKLRFRICAPPLLKSELTKKQIVSFNASSDSSEVMLYVFRDLELIFEDEDDIMPGSSIGPVVKKYKEVVSVLSGGLISSQQLQKSLLRLQKLFGDSLNGVLEPKKNAPTSSATTNGAPASAAAAVSSQPKTHENVQKYQKASIAKLYTDPENALKDVDLQDADDVTIQEYKDKMTEKFNEKVVKPGDAGYVYDKRVETNPTEKSEWDSSDEE